MEAVEMTTDDDAAVRAQAEQEAGARFRLRFLQVSDVLEQALNARPEDRAEDMTPGQRLRLRYFRERERERRRLREERGW